MVIHFFVNEKFTVVKSRKLHQDENICGGGWAINLDHKQYASRETKTCWATGPAPGGRYNEFCQGERTGERRDNRRENRRENMKDNRMEER